MTSRQPGYLPELFSPHIAKSWGKEAGEDVAALTRRRRPVWESLTLVSSSSSFVSFVVFGRRNRMSIFQVFPRF